MFDNEDNFCDFLYAFRQTKTLLKTDILKKERICFPLRTELSPMDVYKFPVNIELLLASENSHMQETSKTL